MYTLIKKHESRNFLLFRESLNLSTAPRDEEMAFVGRGWKEARGGRPEKPLGRQDVRVHTGCPERIEHEVVFLRVNKKTFLHECKGNCISNFIFLFNESIY